VTRDVIFVATFYGSVYVDMHLTCLLNTEKHKEDGNIVRQKRTISMGQLEDMQIFVRIVEAGSITKMKTNLAWNNFLPANAWRLGNRMGSSSSTVLPVHLA
jgi:hypothetical protein